MKYIRKFWNWLTGLFSNKKAESPNIKRFYSKLDANEKALNEHWKDMQLLEYSYKDLMKAFLSTRVTYGRLEPNKESEQVRDLVKAQPARSYIPQFSPLIFLKPLAYILKTIGIIKEPAKPKQLDAGTIEEKKVVAGENDKQLIKTRQPNAFEKVFFSTKTIDIRSTEKYQLARRAWAEAEGNAVCFEDDGSLITKVIKFGLFKYAEYRANQLHKMEDAAKISTNTLRK